VEVVLLEGPQPPAVDESFRGINSSLGSFECLARVTWVDTRGCHVRVLGAVASSAERVETTEDFHTAAVVELRSHRVDDRDVTTSGRCSQTLHGQQRGR
jgi:hypothetical protein